MDRIELMMRRRVVSAFIDADPVYITIERDAPPTRSAAGGLLPSTGPSSLPTQKARLIQNVRRLGKDLVISEAGSIPDGNYLLLGVHTLDVQVDDRFTWEGTHYQVKNIHPFRFESTLCILDYEGKANASS